MEKVKLTVARIDRFFCPEERQQEFLFDIDVPGFGVRALPSGKKAFIFESKLNRKNIRMTIGDVRTWTIEAAIKESRQLKILCDQGHDPRLVKKKRFEEVEQAQLEQKRQEVCFGDAWTNYLAEHKNRWGDRHYKDHVDLAHLGGEKRTRSDKLTIPGPIAYLMPFKLSEVTPELLEAWLKQEVITRPTRAALAFRLVRAFLNWCNEQKEYIGLFSVTAHAAKKVRNQVPESKAKQGCLQREQLPYWFKEINQCSNIIASAYCQTMLLTGARPEELMELEWLLIDFQWKSIKLDDKVNGERIIPLTPYVEKLLLGLPRVNNYVFSSLRSESGHIEDPRYAFEGALERAGLPHLTFYDLRRSFGTLAEWVECPVGIVYQIQGHAKSATAEKHYRVRPLDLLRKWYIKIEEWILKEACLD